MQEAGVGTYFEDSLLSDIESLAFFHGIHPNQFGFYRMLATRFPFAIYYDEKESETHVFAVLDLRSNPTRILEVIARRMT